jgi:hypothetical protein
VTFVSWAAVEVPRYLFYAMNLYMKRVPTPLFFLRYNLFMVLYPSGISGPWRRLQFCTQGVTSRCFCSVPGEILQMVSALPDLTRLSYKLTLSLLGLYVPAGPFMIMNMFGQRKRASKARAEADKAASGSNGPAKVALDGLQFPESGDGDRSTTVAGKTIFAASIAAISPEDAKAVIAEKNWRFGYAKHVVKNVELSLKTPEASIAVAKAGLESAMSSFDFIRDGKSMKLKDAMAAITGGFETGVVKGTKPKPQPKLVVPYKGTDLTEGALLEQLNKCVTVPLVASNDVGLWR